VEFEQKARARALPHSFQQFVCMHHLAINCLLATMPTEDTANLLLDNVIGRRNGLVKTVEDKQHISV
jgi:hypothetical protein